MEDTIRRLGLGTSGKR